MKTRPITLFLAGDVMTGRGIDQVLPDPCEPTLYEPYVRDARDYVALARRETGDFPIPVSPTYVWGESLEILDQVEPDARIANLETSLTRSGDYWRSKGIHYRMSPQNAEVLAEPDFDVCTLANNHVLDWGYEGLAETLETLDRHSILHTGAGRNLRRAKAPATVALEDGRRLRVFGL